MIKKRRSNIIKHIVRKANVTIDTKSQGATNVKAVKYANMAEENHNVRNAVEARYSNMLEENRTVNNNVGEARYANMTEKITM